MTEQAEAVILDLAEHRIRRQGRKVAAIAGPSYARPDGLLDDYLESLRDAIEADAAREPDEVGPAMRDLAHRIDGLTAAREQAKADAMARHPSRGERDAEA